MASASSSPSQQQLDAIALVQRLDSAIKGNPHLSGHQVFCSEEGGTVILQGRVRSYYQKQMAQEALRNLEGVERIVNDLEVDWLTTNSSCSL
ncbi:MAG: BON domain-containing protein [Pirellulaceae bacterium]|nr:BON domain-containing protein [Pirellulaceae bacterium]